MELKMDMRHFYHESPLGILRLGLKDGALATLSPVEDITGSPAASCPELMPVCRWLDAYFDGARPPVNALSLHLRGTGFQMEIWRRLLEIPYGKYVTYGEIAREAAQKRGIARMASQAVGGAVGANPIFIIVPCHRVVGANHELRGYGGGLRMKAALLKHEGVDIGKFKWPGNNLR